MNLKLDQKAETCLFSCILLSSKHVKLIIGSQFFLTEVSRDIFRLSSSPGTTGVFEEHQSRPVCSTAARLHLHFSSLLTCLLSSSSPLSLSGALRRRGAAIKSG